MLTAEPNVLPPFSVICCLHPSTTTTSTHYTAIVYRYQTIFSPSSPTPSKALTCSLLNPVSSILTVSCCPLLLPAASSRGTSEAAVTPRQPRMHIWRSTMAIMCASMCLQHRTSSYVSSNRELAVERTNHNCTVWCCVSDSLSIIALVHSLLIYCCHAAVEQNNQTKSVLAKLTLHHLYSSHSRALSQYGWGKWEF